MARQESEAGLRSHIGHKGDQKMTIPIKIECECGQHYAFDVEPLNGRMPSSVTCPACGADGTVAANNVICQHLVAQPASSPIHLIESPKSASPAAIADESVPVRI